jgi:hypothetical protein
MKKLLLGLMLSAVPMVGCGTGEENASLDTREVVTTEDGQGLILDSNPAAASEHPLASMGSPDSEVTAMGPNCWVTLEYCQYPGTNYGYCTQNGHCSAAQFRQNCIALYKKTC